MHETLTALIERLDRPAALPPDSTAHVLLGAVRIDLLDELLAHGRSHDDLRRELAALAHRLLDGTGPDR